MHTQLLTMFVSIFIGSHFNQLPGFRIAPVRLELLAVFIDGFF